MLKAVKQPTQQTEALADLAPFTDKTIFLLNSTGAVQFIPEKVDFVFLDASKDYCGALSEIERYWPQIRSGGMMAGSDFLDAAQTEWFSGEDYFSCNDGARHPEGLKGAVEKFFSELGLPVFVTYQDFPNNSWIVLKP